MIYYIKFNKVSSIFNIERTKTRGYMGFWGKKILLYKWHLLYTNKDKIKVEGTSKDYLWPFFDKWYDPSTNEEKSTGMYYTVHPNLFFEKYKFGHKRWLDESFSVRKNINNGFIKYEIVGKAKTLQKLITRHPELFDIMLAR